MAYLAEAGRRVFFDAEHFFDGYKHNPLYAMQALKAAADAGACKLILCDTNGGCFPDEIRAITAEAVKAFPGKIGIHCHDDTGCAVADTLAAVKAGADHVQGTYIGFGERCGNTNLSTVIADLQLKLGFQCVPADCIARMTGAARIISEISNVRLSHSMPYVGKSAFAHKGGMHVDGVKKNPSAFEHVDPAAVGNHRQILLSEVSGRSALIAKISEVVPGLTKNSPELETLVGELKELEFQGYQFEAATASFEMVVLKELGRFRPFFALELFRIIGEQDSADRHMASAMVKVRVGDRYEITADEGDGPGPRARPRAAQGARGLLPEPRGGPPHRLQGARHGHREGDRRDGARPDRIVRRGERLDDGRRVHRHHQRLHPGARRLDGV